MTHLRGESRYFVMEKSLFAALVICALLTVCSKEPSNSQANPEASPAAGAEQYGTPFANLPDPRDVVLYQVNIRAFSPEGNFAGVQSRLDAIKALGANVVYLLPTYPVGTLKSVNSPYCVKDYTSVNSEFGTLADLRTLVAEAHKRNMAVLFDWVADHTAWDNAWITHKSWYKQDAAGNIISPPKTGWNDVAALDYKNADMRNAMIEAMKYWIYEANIDGYRCDAADFVPEDFWRQAIAALHAIPGHKLLLLAEGTRADQFTAGFQLEYGMVFYSNMVDNIYAKKLSVRTIDFLNKDEYTDATASDRVVRYISNHDVDQNGTPLDLLGGKRGSLAAFVVAAYMKGAPMIYDGQEVGCPVKLQFLTRGTTIDWSINPDMLEEYKKIIGFRNSSQALRLGDPQSFSSDDVCVFTKSFNTEEVLVIVNLRNAVVSYAMPPALVGTTWKNVFDGTTVALPAGMNLQPFQYQILRKDHPGS